MEQILPVQDERKRNGNRTRSLYFEKQMPVLLEGKAYKSKTARRGFVVPVCIFMFVSDKHPQDIVRMV